MNLVQRSYHKELLDADDIPFEDIRQNMKELDTINTLLGGHAITIAGFKQLAGKRSPITICEIGCGGGDNLAAIVRWANRNHVSVHCTGIDIKQECVDYARLQWQGSAATWIASDYKNVTFESKPDIIFSSLFCHHFTNEELIHQLSWMKSNASAGFFINDLQRHPMAYQSIKILTRLFSSSYLVKNDAPLSVARGFKKNEWQALLEKAGIINYSISWKWAFRYLITCNNG